MAKSPNPKHTACRPGTMVIIKPIHGAPIIDKFVERRHGVIYLEKYGKITKDVIRSFAVWKKRLK